MMRSRKQARSKSPSENDAVVTRSTGVASLNSSTPVPKERCFQNISTILRMILLGIPIFLLILYALKNSITTLHHRTALQAAKIFRGNISGKVFVITGGYSGIGAETAKAILAEGGRVVIGGRDTTRLAEFISSLSRTYLSQGHERNVDGFALDLADLDSVKNFALYVQNKYQKDKLILINNAGIICHASKTKQGLEIQFGVMVVGHFLLSKLLLSKTTRQVWLSSWYHTMLGSPRLNLQYFNDFSLAKDAPSYDEWLNYQQSKVGVMLLAKEFHKRYNVETATLHPGTVWTNMDKHIYSSPLGVIRDTVMELSDIFRQEGWWFPIKSPEEGASTSITVAAMPSKQLKNGGYYKDCAEAEAEESDSAKNMDDAEALFDWCDKFTKAFQYFTMIN